MEFEALEDEASAIHEDLWEQLNVGGQVTPTKRLQLNDVQISVRFLYVLLFS